VKKSLSRVVSEKLDTLPFVREAMDNSLLNYSALARKLHPILEKKMNEKLKEESILVAIKRYSDKKQPEKGLSRELKESFAIVSLSMKDDISYAILDRTPESLDVAYNLCKQSDQVKGNFFSLSMSAGEMMILLDSKKMPELEQKLGEHIRRKKYENSIICLGDTNIGQPLPGFVYGFTKMPADKHMGINLLALTGDDYFLVSDWESPELYAMFKKFIVRARRMEWKTMDTDPEHKPLAKWVREFVDAVFYIRECLADNILNYSAFARKAEPTLSKVIGKKQNEDAIIVAIKRYGDLKQKNKILSKDLIKAYANSNLSMRDDVDFLVLNRSQETLDFVFDICKQETGKQAHFVGMVLGIGKIVLALDSKFVPKIINKLEKHVREHHSMQSMLVVDSPLSDTPSGYINTISKILAKNGISIQLITLPNKLHIFVKSNEGPRTYALIKNFMKKMRTIAEEDKD